MTKISISNASTIKHYLKLTLLLTIQFVVIYGGANWISTYRNDIHHIYFGWERSIPLVPSMAWVYASIFPLMLMPPFYLDEGQLNRLAKQMALAMAFAGAVFLLYPGTVGYDLAASPSRAIGFIRTIDLPYNTFPSLHVALSAIVMLHLRPAMGTRGRALLATWFIALVASVILTHQHHFADVLGAGLLVWFCRLFAHPADDPHQ